MPRKRERPVKKTIGETLSTKPIAPALGNASFQVALFEPAIPQNTGNVSRTCVATGTTLHIVGKPVFSLDDRYLRRAGLDYWPHLDIKLHSGWKEFTEANEGFRIFIFTSRGSVPYTEPAYRDRDIFVFGSESAGLPPEVLDHPGATKVVIPQTSCVRCLNLSNSVAIAVYEAIRQVGIKNC